MKEPVDGGVPGPRGSPRSELGRGGAGGEAQRVHRRADSVGHAGDRAVQERERLHGIAEPVDGTRQRRRAGDERPLPVGQVPTGEGRPDPVGRRHQYQRGHRSSRERSGDPRPGDRPGESGGGQNGQACEKRDGGRLGRGRERQDDHQLAQRVGEDPASTRRRRLPQAGEVALQGENDEDRRHQVGLGRRRFENDGRHRGEEQRRPPSCSPVAEEERSHPVEAQTTSEIGEVLDGVDEQRGAARPHRQAGELSG